MRAIAVIAVIIFHAWPGLLSGGYLGVDIFFVISGFLISSIILKADKFSYKDFYYRRIRRIMPALVIVLIATWFAGWFLLFPAEYKQLCRHILTGLGSVSNIQLWSEVGYFDNAAETKPLLHLWSLGIEEQFYIFWPALLLLWKRKAVVIIGIASLICYYFVFNDNTSFFMLFTRAWELLIGCGLAFYKKVKLKNYVSYVGLVLIIIAIIYHSNMMVTVATALIILTPDNQILSNKVMVRIGLISYPLYLWHWPIMSFMFIFDLKEYIYLAIPASILLAEITYRFIERPKSIKPVLIAIPLLILAAAFVPAKLMPKYDFNEEWKPFKGYKVEIYDNTRIYTNRRVNTDKKVLFWGDSHIQQYAPRIKKISKKSVIFSYLSGQTPCNCYRENEHPQDKVKQYRDAALKMALSDEVDTIVIGASWNGRGLKILPNLEQLLLKIKHKTVYLVIDNPSGDGFDPKNLFDRGTGELKVKAGHTVKQNIEHRQLCDAMIALAKKHNINVINTSEHFVKDGYCKVLYGIDKPIYKDPGHLRTDYVREHCDFMDITVKESNK